MAEENKQMDYGQEVKKEGTGKKMMYIVIVLAVLLVGAVAYLLVRENYIKKRNAELMVAYTRLDSISTQLDEKIREIEELGGNIEELTLVRDSLIRDKEELMQSKVRSDKQLRRLRSRVEGYKELLIIKDAEIAKLKKVNEELVSENTELKTEKNVLTQNLQKAKQTQEKLSKKVAIASRLVAENIEVVALNSRGKEKKGEFRARQIEKLKVTFNIAKNDVAPVEGKDIFMRIIDANDNVLFDVARGSGTFVLDGKETFYTAKQEILFDNTEQQVTFIYDKGSEYLPGLYVMEIYTDGYLMGKKSFKVK